MTEQPTPTLSLVVDDVHVRYRTHGARRRPAAGTPTGGARTWARSLTRHVGAVDAVHAVRGVSFTARHGESIALIGRNGSGKSTLLRAIAGVVPASAGAVYAAGTASLLGVSGALLKDLDGERNIVLGGLALGQTPAEVAQGFDDVVAFAGIGDFVQLPMRAYSSGMAARLRFAISTAARPDIVMIDEALATGDADFRARSRDRIDRIRSEAGTVLLVSHSMSTVRETCTRALWLDGGRLLMDGPVDEVVDAYRASSTAGAR